LLHQSNYGRKNMIGVTIDWQKVAKDKEYKNPTTMFYHLRCVRGQTYEKMSKYLSISQGAIHNKIMDLVERKELKLSNVTGRCVG